MSNNRTQHHFHGESETHHAALVTAIMVPLLFDDIYRVFNRFQCGNNGGGQGYEKYYMPVFLNNIRTGRHRGP
jgi:hypothetical protein